MADRHKFIQEKYGLKDEKEVLETFRVDVSRKKQLKWWINREEELKKWRKVIKESIKLNKNYIVFIIGSYGRGKTLSLYKLIDEAESHKEIYPVYLNFKGEEKSKAGLDFIFRIFRNVNFFKLRNSKTDEEVKYAIENLPETFEEPKNVFNKIYFTENNNSQQKLFTKKTQVQIEKNKLVSRLALSFIRGEIKPTTLQLNQLGIIRKIENIDIAKEYFAALLCFMKNLGYKALLLAVDEFEYLFSLVPKSQHSIYIALLRGLYDFPSGIDIEPENIANIVFFIAVSEDGWTSLKEMEKREISVGGPTVALLDRIDPPTVLRAFNKVQTRELIIKRLKYNRIAGKFEDKPLIPFTEDFVDFIYEKTRGEPRAIITRCGHVLDAGLAKRVPLLTREFAQEVLKERGF